MLSLIPIAVVLLIAILGFVWHMTVQVTRLETQLLPLLKWWHQHFEPLVKK